MSRGHWLHWSQRVFAVAVFVFSALAAAACAPGVYATNVYTEEGLAELRVYCEKDAGVTVFETVEGVRGFYAESDDGCGASCRGGLTRYGYDFVEAMRTPIDRRSVSERRANERYRGSYAPGPGLFRFSVKPAGHANCHGWPIAAETDTRTYFDHVGPDAKLPVSREQGICIAAEPIDNATTQYKIVNSPTSWPVRNGRMSRYEWSVVRISDGRKLGQWIDYKRSFQRTSGLTAQISRVRGCEEARGGFDIRRILRRSD